MNENTSQKIVRYITKHGNVTPKEMSEFLGITKQGLFRHLPKLIESGEITKIGKPPKVFYSINNEKKQSETSFDSKTLEIR